MEGFRGFVRLNLVQRTFVARELGKRLDDRLFTSWGGKPTTQLLRHADRTLDPLTKARYHAFLSQRIGVPFPTVEQEQHDPVSADHCCRRRGQLAAGSNSGYNKVRTAVHDNQVLYAYSGLSSAAAPRSCEIVPQMKVRLCGANLDALSAVNSVLTIAHRSGFLQSELDELNRSVSLAITERFTPQRIRAQVLTNLDRWRAQGVWVTAFDEWRVIAKSEDDARLYSAMVGCDEEAVRLRQSAPYVGLLSGEEVQVLRERQLFGRTWR